jgi:transcriptional regulator with XRE-family HTH domain
MPSSRLRSKKAPVDLPLTKEQCRAARALLGWSQDDLAKESKVAKKTIADFERGERSPYPRTLADIRKALESAGVEFIDNGKGKGAKLRI